MNILINIILYQVIWFLCVLLENTGALIALPLLLFHFYLSSRKKDDAKLMAVLLLTGCVVDGILHYYQYLTFNVSAIPIPPWLAVIWLAFATLPHHSLYWMKGRYLLASFLGFFAGPMSYWAGVKLGAAYFDKSLIISLTILAIIWAVLFPLTIYAAEKIRAKIDQDYPAKEGSI